MLTLLLSAAGNGSLNTMIRRICEDVAAKRTAILIVPEQYSHEMERALCTYGGNSVSLYAEVLSFTRLASRVATVAGGAVNQVLDAGGRFLTMYRAQQMVADQLQLFRKVAQKPDFLSELLKTMDELKHYQVTPDQLFEASEDSEGVQSQRFRELSLLLGAYDALLHGGTIDPTDRMTQLAQGLEQCTYGTGAEIYIHGFTDFTVQERTVVELLLQRAQNMTVTLRCTVLAEPQGNDPFTFARRTGNQLLNMAKRRNLPTQVQMCRTEGTSCVPVLAHLETALLQDQEVPLNDSGEGLEIFSARTAFSEAEYAAARILRLQRETGCRYRDIRVVVRGFETYAGIVDTVFARYGVPVFLSQMTDILEKPILSLVTSALEVISCGYESDDVFHYLKTGLTGLPVEAVDYLENYAIRWSIRGSGWTSSKNWSMHPEGFGKSWTKRDEQLLQALNDWRREVITPLRRLEQSKARTAREQAAALYAFLEEIGLPQRLEERGQVLHELDQRELEEEYHQLWEILCNALDQCVELLGNTPMELSEFTSLFTLMLSQYDVGTIPVSLDRVTAGEAPRMVQTPAQYVFLLGATDTALPTVSDPPGLLLDEDRVFLEGLGLNLSPTAPDRLFREMETIYQVLTMPQKGLFVSWPQHGPEGETLRPSPVIERLRRLAPCAAFENEADQGGSYRFAAPQPALDALALYAGTEAGAHALEQMAQTPLYHSVVSRILHAAHLSRGKLAPQTVQALYGTKISMSASRMDQYQSCQFAYFMRYGLRASLRRKSSFDAPQMGSFVHFVLEHVLTQAAPLGGVKAVSDVWLEQETKRGTERYAEEQLGGLGDKTRRFRYLFSRLNKTVFLVVQNVVDELRHSDFSPLSFELGFGREGEMNPVELTVGDITLSVSGFVDRVDGWEKDGTLYLRVVDYKTGAKQFDLTEIWNGMGMQTLLYLFALEKEGELLYGKPISPAGALYLPARQVILQGERGMTEQARRKKMDAALKRRGLLLDSPEVLEAMEHFDETGVRFLPVRVSKKTGTISGDTLASAVQFETLSRHLDRLLRKIATELQDGKIDANPWYRGPQRSACAFCEFASACHFDETGGDKRRYLPSVKNHDFWKRLEQQAKEPSSGGISMQ